MDEQIPPAVPEQSQQPEPKKPGLSPKLAGIIIGAVVLIAAGSVLGYFQYQKQEAVKLAQQNTGSNGGVNLVVVNNPYATPSGPPDNLMPSGTSTDENYPPTANSIPIDPLSQQPCVDRGPILSSKSGLVQWQSPKLLNITIFASTTENSGYSDYGVDYSYKVGQFTGGQYQGGDLLLTFLTLQQPGGSMVFRIVKLGNKYTVLDKYSDGLPFDTSAYTDNTIKSAVSLTEDISFDLPDLDFPPNLDLQNPPAGFSLSTNLGFSQNGHQFFCADGLVKAFPDQTAGDIYTDASASGTPVVMPEFGFYAKSPDGTFQSYQLNLDFVGKDNVPVVTWDGGKKNTQEYTYQAVGGCGPGDFLDIVDVGLPDLKEIGTNFDGQPVYAYKDPNAQEMQDMYSEMTLPNGQPQPAYSVFVASRPMFFWQDPFGDFVRFKSSAYQPLAECAKPVIYLYPQQTEKVSVSINPVGGMTKSVPAYNNGWNVTADPNSSITNLADGRSYPYLFWEGNGGMYQTPDRGFVVAQSGVHQLLEDKLSMFGLTQNERQDFENFWQPKMQNSPYYFVTFMGNNVMDQIAPLSISPKPDTIIRVLMDFKPLAKPIPVQGYTVPTPIRKGFTVVEWGGVLR